MNWKRVAVITIVALALVAAIYWGMRPQPLEVETAVVRIGPMETTVEEEGKTRLRDRFLVSAPLAGIMRRHEWKVGDSIAAGRAITSLIPQRSELLDTRRLNEGEARLAVASAGLEGSSARLKSAQEQLKVAVVDVDYWKLQLSREERLAATGDIPATRLDRTRTEFNRAQAVRLAAVQAINVAQTEMDRSRSEVAAARAAIGNPGLKSTQGAVAVPVVSPVAGRVVRVLRQSEGVVQSGEPILELGDTRALEVEVELLSSDAVRVAPGTAVRLTRWGGEVPLEARVRLIEPTGFTKISALGVEEQRVRVIADLVSPADQWQRLGEGYRVEASFILWSAERVLQLPSSALFRESGKWAAFVVSEGVARKRILEIGHRNGLVSEALSGINEGELVVPHPDEKLQDGAAVKPLSLKQ